VVDAWSQIASNDAEVVGRLSIDRLSYNIKQQQRQSGMRLVMLSSYRPHTDTHCVP